MNKVMNVGALVMDELLQSRTEIIEETVADYAEALKEGRSFRRCWFILMVSTIT